MREGGREGMLDVRVDVVGSRNSCQVSRSRWAQDLESLLTNGTGDALDVMRHLSEHTAVTYSEAEDLMSRPVEMTTPPPRQAGGGGVGALLPGLSCMKETYGSPRMEDLSPSPFGTGWLSVRVGRMQRLERLGSGMGMRMAFKGLGFGMGFGGTKSV